MLGLKRRKTGSGEPFTFRVSDVVEVPLRGVMLRLRLVDGQPSMGDLGEGAKLLLRDARGTERSVRVAAHAVTGGRPTQKRLDRTRELDVIIEPEPADAPPIEIGWMATGPVA
jgi:hypothetical protein